MLLNAGRRMRTTTQFLYFDPYIKIPFDPSIPRSAFFLPERYGIIMDRKKGCCMKLNDLIVKLEEKYGSVYP